jgi:ribosomal protein S18 acetylase RimI-like enzyme
VSQQKIHVRPAGPGDRDQVWPLARDLATSYVVERAAFDQSYEALLATPTALLLIAEAPLNPSGPVYLSPNHPASPSGPSGPSGPASLSEKDSGGAVAEGGGEVVGYLLATSHPAFHANGPVAWVEEVMVAHPARGTGVGCQLMAAAEAWARDREAAYVALATRRAAEFYRALGYEESAVYFKKPLT